jgi:hypothetical protein
MASMRSGARPPRCADFFTVLALVFFFMEFCQGLRLAFYCTGGSGLENNQ